MEQIIIASHTIKPSSPTPFTSKYQKLSLFDQIIPQSMYIPLIFFYKSHDSKQHEEISRRLKQSLSEILTVFYPLAGTIHQNSHVDCNDKGAEFVEARAHARLSQFLENPKMEELRQLLRPDSLFHDDDDVILSVKTCFFDCGGISVGICLSHKVADGESAVAFMKAWAATCRTGEASGTFQSPSFDLPLHFPPIDLPPASVMSQAMAKEKFVTKRLVFSRAEVEKMVAEASTGEIKDPSRVEAVTAFIWRSFIQAGTGTTSFTATHAVNLRPRAVPRLPNRSFGNCITVASAVIWSREDGEGGNTSGMLVSKLRAAIRAVDDDYVKYVKTNADVAIEALTKQASDVFGSGNCGFSSWWRFPVYEVDFGWGKPVWVSTAPMPYMNLVLLMDTPSGDGVEAWINVRDEDIFRVFQDNYNKLLAHKLH